MSRVWNFSAGPSCLPEEVLKECAAEMLDCNGTGQSVMEMSHRSSAFEPIIQDAEARVRKLMKVPEMFEPDTLMSLMVRCVVGSSLMWSG